MSPQCSGCGAHVSTEWVRVMLPDEQDTPERCQQCPDTRKHDTYGGGLV